MPFFDVWRVALVGAVNTTCPQLATPHQFYERTLTTADFKNITVAECSLYFGQYLLKVVTKLTGNSLFVLVRFIVAQQVRIVFDV